MIGGPQNEMQKKMPGSSEISSGVVFTFGFDLREYGQVPGPPMG
jgi:hypothetical protein